MLSKKFFSYVLVIIILVLLFFNVSKDWQTVTRFKWNFNIENILLIFLFWIPTYLVTVFSWHLLTKSLSFNLTFTQNLRIWLYSNMGRFIPGAVWQYVGRVYLANKEGVTKSEALSALGLEAVFNLTAAFLVILTAIFFWGLPTGATFLSITAFLIPTLIIIIAVLNNTKTINYFLNIISKLTKKEQHIIKISLPLKWIPILLISYTLQFVVGGSVLFFLTRTAVDLSWSLYPLFIGIFASAWLLGYVTVFAPSGLGVQELSIAGLLSPYIPFSVAGVIAILFRLLMLASELFTICFFYSFEKFTAIKTKNSC